MDTFAFMNGDRFTDSAILTRSVENTLRYALTGGAIRLGNGRQYFMPDGVRRVIGQDVSGHSLSIVAEYWHSCLGGGRSSVPIAIVRYIRQICGPIVPGSVRNKDGERKPHKYRTLSDAADHSEMIQTNSYQTFGRFFTESDIENIRQTLTPSESRLFDTIVRGSVFGWTTERILKEAKLSKGSGYRRFEKLKKKIAV